MEESTGLLDLPYDIIEIIYGYCNGSLVDIACCCKDLYNSVLPTLWRNINMTENHFISLQKMKNPVLYSLWRDTTIARKHYNSNTGFSAEDQTV